jgi:hypothetical protein
MDRPIRILRPFTDAQLLAGKLALAIILGNHSRRIEEGGGGRRNRGHRQRIKDRHAPIQRRRQIR